MTSSWSKLCRLMLTSPVLQRHSSYYIAISIPLKLDSTWLSFLSRPHQHGFSGKARFPDGVQVNLLTPGISGSNFTSVSFKPISWIDILSTSRKIGLRWMPQNPIDDKSTLVQVMAWCRQATLRGPKFTQIYVTIIRPQWVNRRRVRAHEIAILKNVIWSMIPHWITLVTKKDTVTKWLNFCK